MDYIIIALWGLITGGVIWGNTLRNNGSQPAPTTMQQSVMQVTQPEVAETPVAIEQPLVSTTPKKRSGKSKPVAFTKSNSQSSSVPIVDDVPIVDAVPIVDDVPVADALPVLTETASSAEQNNAIVFVNGKSSDKPASAPKRKAISFSNQKPEEPEVPIADVPLADAPVLMRDTVIVFRVVTDEGELLFSTDEESTAVAITEPLFESEPAPTSVYKQSGLTLPGQLTIEQLMCDDDGKPLIHTLQRGETLTQIAQRYYSDSRFWPYIFEVNRHLLSSPDKIQADMKLYLPDPVHYGIDEKNAASVDKAKALINKYMK